MCLWYLLTGCSHTSQGQRNDWKNLPCYTVITQLAFTWEIGISRVTTALLHGGNLKASRQLQKKQNSLKHSSLWLLTTLHNQDEICLVREAMSSLPTWGWGSAATKGGFPSSITPGGSCTLSGGRLGSEDLLGMGSHQFAHGFEPILTQHPNWSNWTVTQVRLGSELWCIAGYKPDLALSVRAKRWPQSASGPAIKPWKSQKGMKGRKFVSEDGEDALTQLARRTAVSMAVGTSRQQTHGVYLSCMSVIFLVI